VESSALRQVALQTRVEASPCVDAQVEQDAVQWTMISAAPTAGSSDPAMPVHLLSYSQLLQYTRQRGRQLAIPAGVLRAGQTYALRATVVQRLNLEGSTTEVSASTDV